MYCNTQYCAQFYNNLSISEVLIGRSNTAREHVKIQFNYTNKEATITTGSNTVDLMKFNFTSGSEAATSVKKMYFQPTTITQGGLTGTERTIVGYDSGAKAAYVGIDCLGHGEQPFLLFNEYTGAQMYGLTVGQLSNQSGYNQTPLTVDGETKLNGNTTITNTANGTHLGIINTASANGSATTIRMGYNNDTSSSNHGVIQYFHYSNQTDRHFDLGINSHSQIRMFDSSTKFLGKIESKDSTPDNSFGDNMKGAILKLMYPVGSVYQNATDSRNPNDIFGFGSWTSIFTGYERQCIGSQVLYKEIIGSGTKNKVSLLGAYDYRLIEGVFSNITIPSGYHKEYRLTFQGSTGGSPYVQVFLNNIATNGAGTWSGDSFRVIGASEYFKESDITLETTYNYSSPGINLKYSNSGNSDYRIYNITIHGFIVSDTQTYKWKRTA